MKKYIHEKRNQLQSALWHEGNLKRQPELFPSILDENGELVDPSDIARKNELVGAGLQYTMSIVDYFCTHRKSELQLVDGSAKRIKIPTLTWEMAIDIATADIPGQRDRAEAAILNLRAMQKPVFFYDFDYDTNGLSYSMIPFIIDLTFDNDEKITTEKAAKIARIIKARKKYIAENNIEKLKDKKGNFKGSFNQQYKVIKYIDIQFAKPLYEGFFRKKSGNYSFPTGMYAQFYAIGHKIVKLSPDAESKNASTEPYIDFYCRLARYLALHNNMENDEDYASIHKSLGEIMAEVLPVMVQWVNGQPHPKDINKSRNLLIHGFLAIHQLSGFNVYPAFEGSTPEGKYVIGLYRKAKDAIIAMNSLISKKNII